MLEGEPSVGGVLSIAQDSYGFIWFGGMSGLVRYDGYRYHLYEHDPSVAGSLTENSIRDVFADSYGELWVATYGGGVLRYNREMDSFYNYTSAEFHGTTSPDLRIRKIFEDDQKQLWVSGEIGGISLYNRENNTFQLYLQDTDLAKHTIEDMEQIGPSEYVFTTIGGGVFHWQKNSQKLVQYTADSGEPNSLGHNIVRSVYQDSRGKVWIGTELGLNEFLPQEGIFTNVNVLSAELGNHISIWDMIEGNDGMLWLASDGSGLIFYDPITGEQGWYENNATNTDSLSCDVVRTVFFDVNDDFWIGCFPGGVNHFDRSNKLFRTYTNFTGDATKRSSVWALSEDDAGNIWIGTEHNSLFYFDMARDQISTQYQGKDLNSLGLPDTVLALFQDSRNNLWVGTWAEGLYKIHLDTFIVEHYKLGEEDNRGFNAESVWRIVEDEDGDIWIGTMYGGIYRYNVSDDRFKNYRTDPSDFTSINDNRIWTIHHSKTGDLWFGTQKGAAKYNRETDSFIRYVASKNNKSSLSHNWVQEFYDDGKGKLWIATQGGGVNIFDYNVRKFSYLNEKNGLSSNLISGITQDDLGHMWFSSNHGLNRFDTKKETFRHFSSKNWLQNNLFFRGAYLKLKSGKLVFGGLDGFSLFDPKQVVENTYITPTYITEFKVFNRLVTPGLKQSPLKKDIVLSDNIILKHTQNSFSLAFTSLSYRSFENNQFSYFLEGFDQEWSPAGENNVASYTNLDPGKYAFYVKSSNSSGIWNTYPTRLSITVLPSPWKTWWAYSLYVGFCIFIVLWIFYNQRKQILNERKVNERLREIDTLKDEILANTSHELRTPLNGIIGLAEIMRDGQCGQQTTEGISNLSMIVSSAKRLSSLVNDILDFTKIKNSEMTLDFKQVNVYDLICDVIYQLSSIVNQDKVTLHNRVSKNIGSIFADENRSHQIIMNLVGNAIKYTREGSIEVHAKKHGEMIAISVTDTGLGIADEFQKQIFKAFEQASNSGVYAKNGTGLGLAITEKLVKLHHGRIEVESKLGEGSTFTVFFPKKRTPIHDEDMSQKEKMVVLSKGKDDDISLHEQVSLDLESLAQPLVNEFDLFFLAASECHEGMCAILDQAALLYTICENLSDFDKSLNRSKKQPLLFLCATAGAEHEVHLCRSIRSHYNCVDLPIILVLHNLSGESIAKFSGGDVNQYISKDIDSLELISRLKNIGKFYQSLDGVKNNPDIILSNNDKTIDYDLPLYRDRRGIAASKSKKKALVVDDEAVNRIVLRHQLINFDFDVYEADTGEKAIEVIESGALFDIVFLDIMMPGMSGYDVCKAIREKYNMITLPIIFVSAKSQPSDYVKALNLGGNDILAKPIDLKLLYATIDSCLNPIDEISHLQKITECEEI